MGCWGSKQAHLQTIPKVGFKEVFVRDDDVDRLIDKCQEDLRQIMTSALRDAVGDQWQEEQCPGIPSMRLLYGYTAEVQGPLVVTTYTFPGVDPDALFRWLTSVEGFKIIDPDTKNHERMPVQTLAWRDRAYITHGLAVPPMSCMHTRTFMVLNAMDHQQRLFISVPVLHDQFPKEKEAANKQIRALNVWASWIVPAPGGARMISFCWFHMKGMFPSVLTDRFMRKKFMQGFHTRLIKAVGDLPELRLNTDTSTGARAASTGNQVPAGASKPQGTGGGVHEAAGTTKAQSTGSQVQEPAGVAGEQIKVGGV